MRNFIRVMKALSDPNRVLILKLLEQRVLCVCELRELLGLAQPTVSRHLKVLEEARLIDFSRDGLWVNYRLAGKSDNPCAAAMLDHLKQWLDDDPRVAGTVEQVPFVNRENICNR
ncbi:MAG TPA: ArsR family transcriptional regulator [Deltaproteobacteria bacterium]|jgi:ArsR family transcriptional regulator|nr:ArsR family transcriptional regulator [Deltaproteobacteria bacterium]